MDLMPLWDDMFTLFLRTGLAGTFQKHDDNLDPPLVLMFIH